MEIKEFIEKFAEAVEIEDVETLSPETQFHKLQEWNSLAYLSVIAMLDSEFGIQIEMAEFNQLVTIQDILDKATSLQ